jgi:hypothetical protein
MLARVRAPSCYCCAGRRTRTQPPGTSLSVSAPHPVHGESGNGQLVPMFHVLNPCEQFVRRRLSHAHVSRRGERALASPWARECHQDGLISIQPSVGPWLTDARSRDEEWEEHLNV